MFAPATKKNARVRLALEGPAGSGKTYSALAIATQLGGTVAFIDTESGSAAHYADVFDFCVHEMGPPFEPARFVDAINGAVKGGFTTIIIDSLSHAWEGQGGLLEIVDNLQKRRGTRGFAAWKDATPRQRALVEAIIRCPINVIATMRTKTDYVLEETTNSKGHKTQAPRRVGLKAVQRDGMEYEFDVVMRMQDGEGTVVKSRCPALTEQVYRHPGEQVAGHLREWLGEGVCAPAPKPKPKPMTEAAFNAWCEQRNLSAALVMLWRDSTHAQGKSPGWGGTAGDFRRHGTTLKLEQLAERVAMAQWIVATYAERAEDCWPTLRALTDNAVEGFRAAKEMVPQEVWPLLPEMLASLTAAA